MSFVTDTIEDCINDSLTAYEAFGVYPWCLDALSHWIHCAVAVIYHIDHVKGESNGEK